MRWLVALTVLTAVLAVIPRFLYHRSEYDPIVALTMLTVVGIVWYTYYSRKALLFQEQSTKQRASRLRVAVATATLSELARLLARLETIYDSGPAGQHPDFIRQPFLESASRQPDLFSSNTIQLLADAFTKIQDEHLALERYRDVSARVAAAGSLITGTLQNDLSDAQSQCLTRAYWAFVSLVALVSALVGEGGVMPPGSGKLEVLVTQLPKLAPNPFEK